MTRPMSPRRRRPRSTLGASAPRAGPGRVGLRLGHCRPCPAGPWFRGGREYWTSSPFFREKARTVIFFHYYLVFPPFFLGFFSARPWSCWGEKESARHGSVTPPPPSGMAIETACRSSSSRESWSSSHSDAPGALAAAAQTRRGRRICGDLVVVVVVVVVDDHFRRRFGLPPRKVGGRAPGDGSGRVPGANKGSK